MTPLDRSRKALAGVNVRRVLEGSNLPMEVATAIADVLEGLYVPGEEKKRLDAIAGTLNGIANAMASAVFVQPGQMEYWRIKVEAAYDLARGISRDEGTK